MSGSLDPMNVTLGIAVAGPDVGMVGSRESLEARGNEVKDVDGGVISKEMFPDLYEAIAGTFGESREHGTFQLPDLRVRVPPFPLTYSPGPEAEAMADEERHALVAQAQKLLDRVNAAEKDNPELAWRPWLVRRQGDIR
jgi:hypothetical protein